MRVLDRIEQVRKELEAARQQGREVGLVPTMGALHAGHAALIERSARHCDVTAVTVFVNPLQFGPAEDFARYPRDLAADVAAAEAAGADVVFAPPVEEMYPSGVATRVEVGRLGEVMEGAARPGHFSGVATVVAKLFAIAGPCRAYFGEKDYQQLLVVRRVAADLSFPVVVVGCPTVREADGLAMSSRNRYLSPGERLAATVLWRALAAAAASGEGDGDALRELMARFVSSEPDVALDYAEVADAATLEPLGTVEGEARLLIAARVGATRLIDNLPLGVAA
ncbi:MAG TPA: pantoate--beta-alanine ligase [Acidimicrobiales bacterium]|nr:pantoate--beta-alanine ligase [Acidimicrobiales bacterium]